MDPLSLPLDYTVIEHILPHRYPFLLVDRVTESNSQWADRSARWKLILANPARLSRPVPCLGSLNLFEVAERLVRDLLPPGTLHELPPGRCPCTFPNLSCLKAEPACRS